MPPALANKVELYADLLPIWELYKTLSKSRQYAFSPQQLQVSDILALWQVTPDIGFSAAKTVQYIQILDKEFIAKTVPKKRPKVATNGRRA